VVGCTFLVAGCSVVGWALAERRRYDRARFDLERPQSLVTTGPYAFSRHPMYVGWWLIHLGAGVLRGSSWVVVTAPAAVLAEHRSVLAEERQLADSFGRTFDRYAERVPRYGRIPFPRGRSRK
jgi:protein-S-isoprenylcysteine O-methyltransferase Ste14